MIALHERDSKNSVDATQEETLYAETVEKVDPRLTQHQYSSPQNILATARKNGLNAALYKTEEIRLSDLADGQEQQLKDFVDTQSPTVVDRAQLIKLLDSGWLQVLTYADRDQEKKHWLLLRKQGSSYYLYDTGRGVNQEVVKIDDILAFDQLFEINKPNNDEYCFLGVAIHLT
ncbi:hypothetical protein WA1_29095 [Scytonema hofmannii PCC 7110]|uniref:Uncharacterized protein n=2 Tax=Scytonema hofmannii TaxID=34078 RepID=A0A139X5S7_9CYAN|nr:hypothetical protein WA1_29095 [Scytonema hofmannii PCC 7110]